MKEYRDIAYGIEGSVAKHVNLQLILEWVRVMYNVLVQFWNQQISIDVVKRESNIYSRYIRGHAELSQIQHEVQIT